MTAENQKNQADEDDEDIEERLLAILIIGICESLRSRYISGSEAECLLFSPGAMKTIKRSNLNQDLYKILWAGTELESVRRIVSGDSWLKSIEDVQKRAAGVLNSTRPVNGYCHRWFRQFVSERSE